MNGGSKGARIAGLVLSGLIGLFLVFDGALKLVQPKVVTDTNARLGIPPHELAGIGVTLIVATLLYIVPMTAILGAVLLTGYLGGAVATHVRTGSSIFETLFPVIVGVLIWISMLLRERRLRELLPVRLGRGRNG